MPDNKPKKPEEPRPRSPINGVELPIGQRFQPGEDAREKGRRGGQKARKIEREKRTARQMLEEIMSYKPVLTPALRAGLANLGADPDEGSYTAGFLGMVALQNRAMKGDVKAVKLWLEITGQDPRVLLEQDRLALEMQNASHVAGFSALDAAVDAMKGDADDDSA